MYAKSQWYEKSGKNCKYDDLIKTQDLKHEGKHLCGFFYSIINGFNNGLSIMSQTRKSKIIMSKMC